MNKKNKKKKNRDKHYLKIMGDKCVCLFYKSPKGRRTVQCWHGKVDIAEYEKLRYGWDGELEFDLSWI